MADWKVSVEEVEIFEHPNADKMELARVGMYGLVVGKGEYVTGDRVVFIPKRSVIPACFRDLYDKANSDESYLKGGHTVKSVRLRGELSEGVVIPFKRIRHILGVNSIEDMEIGIDISEKLGIEEFQIYIPPQFVGNWSIATSNTFSRHDCENIRLYTKEFAEKENILVTSKIHGSQINIMFLADGKIELSSKGMIGKNFIIDEADDNIYWKALYNSGIIDIVKEKFPGKFVQMMGEVVPVQKGFTYGFNSERPDILFFRLEIEGERFSAIQVREQFPDIFEKWVPVIYEGEFDVDFLYDIANYETIDGKKVKRMEGISGKRLNIEEGIVVEPVIPRLSKKGHFPLITKIISDAYAKKHETDDDIS